MKTSVNINLSEELMYEGMTLKEQEVEQVSGGAGATNEIPENIILIVLMAAGIEIINTFFKKHPNEKEFYSWINGNYRKTHAMIYHINETVAEKYASWLPDVRNQYWRTVWASI